MSYVRGLSGLGIADVTGPASGSTKYTVTDYGLMWGGMQSGGFVPPGGERLWAETQAWHAAQGTLEASATIVLRKGYRVVNNDAVVNPYTDATVAHLKDGAAALTALPTATAPVQVVYDKTAAQNATIQRLMREDPAAADQGNVPAKYASATLHADGSLGGTGDAVLDAQTPAGVAYWQGIFRANRYLVLLASDGRPFTTVGAIGAPASAAILSTYTAPDAQGRSLPTAQTAVVEAAVKAGNIPAVVAAPFSQPASAALPAPVVVTPTRTVRDPGITMVYTGGPAIDFGGGDAPPQDLTGPETPPGVSLASVTGGLPSWAPLAIAAAAAFFIFGRKR